MTLETIISSQDSLSKILNLKLPIKVAYKISKLVNRMQPDLKIYEEQRTKLVKELGELVDEKTDSWRVKAENSEKFNEEIKKVLDVEVDLNFGPGKELEKIKIEDLGALAIEPRELISLGWLFE